MTTEAYRPRLIDTQINRYLRVFGGVLIEGPKWCGKTWTGLHHAASAIYADDPGTRQLAELAPRDLLDKQPPLLVDEWQDAPRLWDVARRIIDTVAQRGLFIFTGSAVPPQEATRHTGTGRFARLRLRPMSLFETGDSSGAVSLRALLDGAARIETAVSRMTYQEAVRLICRGGWPMSLDVPDEDALLLPRSYLQAVVQSDISRADGVARDPVRVMAVLRSLARNNATFTRLSKIQDDVRAQEDASATVSESTIRAYLNALTSIFVLEDLLPWRFSLRSKTQLLLSPKRHFVDPSLAVAALDADPNSLAADPNTAGLLFESLVVRDLRIYAQANDAAVFHYHDNKGLEADAVVVAPGGRWGAVEVKLGFHEADAAAATLLRLKAKLASEPSLTAPSFLAVVTATGGVAHTRDDGVHVIPIDCLGV